MKHNTTTPYSTRIARVNDQFRRRAGLPPAPQGIPGVWVCTRRITALPPTLQQRIWAQVRAFQAFDVATNDPYGEHHAGALTLQGVGRVCWRITYYADATMTRSASEPADPTQSYRLLMVRLVAESCTREVVRKSGVHGVPTPSAPDHHPQKKGV